jgi:hypothetical protein
MNYNTLPQLEAVQLELDKIKSYQLANQNAIANTVPNFQEMVQQAVQAEIKKLIPTQDAVTQQQQMLQEIQSGQVVQPAQPGITDPKAALVNEIDKFAQSILQPEQVKWLSDPTILSGVPLFFKSEKGKQAIQLLFSEYQDYVNR